MNDCHFKPGDWVERCGWKNDAERMGLVIAVIDHSMLRAPYTTVTWRELWVLYPNMTIDADMDEKWRLGRASEP